MTSYRDQIAAAVRGVGVLSGTRFHWLGRASPELSARARAAVPEASLRSYLVFHIEQCLYQFFYCSGGVTGGDEPETPGRPGGDPEFVETLTRANRGTGSSEDGWTVQDVERDFAIASRGALSAMLHPDDVLEPWPPTAGSKVRTRLPAEFRSVSPGFYMASGDEPLPDVRGEIVRLYWNVTPEGAAALLRRLTLPLNRWRVPFRLKVVNEPRLFRRCDAAVLYLCRTDYPRILPILGEVHRRVSDQLRASTPALTKRMAPGVALAEDPPEEESFGTSRCRLIAEGVVRAHEAECRNEEERLTHVYSRFREADVSLDTPYLNPGAMDGYGSFTPGDAEGGPRRMRADRADRDPLDAAVELGEKICDSAIRHGARCAWIGPEPAGPTSSRWSPLGPDLYSGCGGIGLVLAELHRMTNHRRFGETALGAAHQCLDLVRRMPQGAPSGLYEGWSGALLAAARTGVLLGSSSLVRASIRCARERGAHRRSAGGFDLVSGRAGAIVSLVALDRLTVGSSFLEFTTRIGDALVRSAERSRRGISWRPAGRALQNLTGLAHGAAGAALALVELYEATRESRFRIAAEQAFDYERSWFDRAAGNWPDFRLQPGERPRSTDPRGCGMAWCHGAPGIALSRLRAMELLGELPFESEFAAAQATTRDAVESEMERGPGDLSLCHGFTGRCDVLREGGRTLDARERRALARRMTRHVRLRAMEDRATAPGLMLGLAGRAYYLLRLIDPAVPSLLLVRPERLIADRDSR